MKPIMFVLPEQQQTVAGALGMAPGATQIEACPYMPGDYVNFPGATLMYRVRGRIAFPSPDPEDSQWVLLLEACQNPIDEPPYTPAPQQG